MTPTPTPLTEAAERVASKLDAALLKAKNRSRDVGNCEVAGTPAEHLTAIEEEQAAWKSVEAQVAALAEERDRLAGALEPFAKLEFPKFGVKDRDVAGVRHGELRIGDFRRARTALNPKSEKSDG